MAKKSAAGSGTIRKKTVTRNGKTYTFWEARYTAGFDPGTGKQIQRSISGKTQKEVAQKLKAVTAAIDAGTYTAPNKMTLGEWLDIWAADYLGGVKPRTTAIYKSDIRNHIKPALGAIRLEALDTHTIQQFYNRMADRLSAKTIKNIHGVLHHALNQATVNKYIRFNPADACTLPRCERKELKPLDEDQISAFMQAIKGDRFEDLFLVTLFTGLRQGEVLGLTWDCVDFSHGILTINKQMQLHQEEGVEAYKLVSTKNGKARTIAAAPSVLAQLKHRRAIQAEQRLKAGPLWEDSGLVFTDDIGHHLTKPTVYRSFKRAVAAIGRPEVRFHDLRHSYAVVAIKSGDDIKTVQGNLGHATASFTLDVYGHVTDQMKKDSANRMEAFIKSVSGK